MRSLDLAVVSTDSRFRARAQELARTFDFDLEIFASADSFFEKAESYKSISGILLDCGTIEKPNEVAGMVQVASQIAASSYIIAVINSKLSVEDTRVVKTSGAALVMMSNEVYDSSKLEFVTTQVIRSAFIPIKTLDLIPHSSPRFALYHLMPANRKFLKVANPDISLTSEFLTKFSETGELHIRREDLPAWIEYCKKSDLWGPERTLRQCRLRFLQLNQSFLSLALMISDQSAAASFALGRELFAACEKFARELVEAFNEVQNPLAIINAAAIGDFGSLERAPAIASYAAVMSRLSGVGTPLEVMIAALLADLGYLDLSPSASEKLRQNRLDEMHAEEIMEYRRHPIYSVNQCLSRKLPLTERIKMMILQSHERVDQKGFPYHPQPEKILEEAMLIRLAWTMDNLSLVRMGKQRQSLRVVIDQLTHGPLEESGSYSISFMLKMKPALTRFIPGAGPEIHS